MSMTPTELVIRAAAAGDVDDAVPLIYSSGPAAFDYVFSVPGTATAQQFLRAAFADGRGEFGWHNHLVAELDGRVIAAGAGWTASSNLRFALGAGRQILRRYGFARGMQVIARGLRIEAVIQPPRRGCWYIAHLGVRPDVRSRGIGEALVRQLLRAGGRAGCNMAELDVAATNDRAQALYERLGFVVTRERRSSLRNAQGVVPDHLRMALPL
jgi:ribosomal protein S18 acetylase RimI-like enzyme